MSPHHVELAMENRAVLALLLAAAGATIVAAVVVRLVRRNRTGTGAAVRTLAAALGLRARDRRLLSRVARLADGAHPGALLVSRGCFDRAAARYERRFGAASALEGLRRRVFDDAPAPDRRRV